MKFSKPRRLMETMIGLLAATALAGGGSSVSPVLASAPAMIPPASPATIYVNGPLGSVGSTPTSLTPAFDPAITDYVWRCQTGVNQISVRLSAVSGGEITVDGSVGSSFLIPEKMVQNQALVIFASDPLHPNQPDVQYWIRCLPHDFPRLSVTKTGVVPAGWYLTGDIILSGQGNGYVMILDNNGTPVWYQQSPNSAVINTTLLADTSIAWTTGWNSAYEVFNLATGVASTLTTPIPPLDAHALNMADDGDLMLLSGPTRTNVDMSALGLSAKATIIDCVIQKVTPSGHLVWQWDALDHIALSESTHPTPSTGPGPIVYDPYHCNSLDTDPVAGTVLLSTRHTDAVYLIDQASSKIIWKMGGTPSNQDGAKVLTIKNDPERGFQGQHDAKFQPNGDISLFDDHSWDTSQAARGVEYHVDEGALTATLVWSFASPDGKDSKATGSFRRLDGGNDNVIGWGFKQNALFTEVDAKGNILMNVEFPDGQSSYRVKKVASTSVDLSLLRTTAGLVIVKPTSNPAVVVLPLYWRLVIIALALVALGLVGARRRRRQRTAKPTA